MSTSLSVAKPRAALITGGSGGIGSAIIGLLSARGITCINLDRVAPAGSSPARFVSCDLADATARAEALATITAEFDVLWLVNNAAIVAPAALDEAKADDFARVAELNLWAVIACTQAVLPAMRAHRFGRIVNLASRAALGKELRTVYAATKAGIIGMTRTWALELGADGITVNAIGPGPIETELFRASNPPDSPRTRAIIDGIPVRRLGRAEDVAHAACFFLDEQTSFVTGQTLYVCGGLTVGAA
jgi:3-oxoacyl-[acyl-carrier protein] reductase